jgi:predicted nucleotide-binding protein
LHEQANENQAIIEKLRKHSLVSFAVILLSPDDKGCKIEDYPSGIKYRARQNVVLELGYFTGKLNNRITIIYRSSENFEMPTDYAGVVWIPYDANGAWKFMLSKELRNAGFPVDDTRISR